MISLNGVFATVLVCSMLVGVSQVTALWILRNTGLHYQLAAAAATPVVTGGAFLVGNMYLMLLPDHDSTVVLLTLAMSLPVAVLGACEVMRRVSRTRPRLVGGVSEPVEHVGIPTDQHWHGPGSALSTANPAGSRTVITDLNQVRSAISGCVIREHAPEQARLELIGFLSRDLRTPLSGLRALAEGLEDGVIADVPHALARLRAEVSRITALVDDLFELTDDHRDTGRTAYADISLVDLLAGVAQELHEVAYASAVTFEVRVPHSDRLVVLGSAVDLTQAMADLATNAIRSTERGAAVRLEAARAADGQVLVAVTDSCGGLPISDFAHLNREHPTSSTSDGVDPGSGHNTGIGPNLAVTRRVVESHAGLFGRSQVTGGCRFHITLPAS